MNTKAFRRFPAKVILSALLFTSLIPTVEAQQLTLQLPVPSRRVLNPLVVCSQDVGCVPHTPFSAITNDPGAFYASSTESVSATFASVANTCLQDSTVTATATSLTVTGLVEVSCDATLFEFSTVVWDGIESSVVVGFVIDRPFTYSLQATTAFEPSFYESSACAMTGLSNLGYGTTALPNLVAYGRIANAATDQTAPSASGTNTGVIPAGTYYFQAQAHSASYVTTSPPHLVANEHFLAAFNFTVAFVPQPPAIMEFTPNGDGTFNLIWDAVQAGNYRVLSSTNLTAWSELIPAAAQPFGHNTNVVNILPGANAGFFRIEYLP